MTYVEQLQTACGYDPDEDGSVDALIAYKDALEDAVSFVEGVLHANAEGDCSAADVCGELWSRGFDPEPTEANRALGESLAALDPKEA